MSRNWTDRIARALSTVELSLGIVLGGLVLAGLAATVFRRPAPPRGPDEGAYLWVGALVVSPLAACLLAGGAILRRPSRWRWAGQVGLLLYAALVILLFRWLLG